jgi:hypothetical protein
LSKSTDQTFFDNFMMSQSTGVISLSVWRQMFLETRVGQSFGSTVSSKQFMTTAALTACSSFEGGSVEGGSVEGGSAGVEGDYVEEEGYVGGGSNEVLLLESTKAVAADTSTTDLALGA